MPVEKKIEEFNQNSKLRNSNHQEIRRTEVETNFSSCSAVGISEKLHFLEFINVEMLRKNHNAQGEVTKEINE